MIHKRVAYGSIELWYHKDENENVILAPLEHYSADGQLLANPFLALAFAVIKEDGNIWRWGKVIGRESDLIDRPDPPRHVPERIRDVTCPQCKQPFELSWMLEGMKPWTLRISDCPSGGIYGVSIECPHCNYEEEL